MNKTFYFFHFNLCNHWSRANTETYSQIIPLFHSQHPGASSSVNLSCHGTTSSKISHLSYQCCSLSSNTSLVWLFTDNCRKPTLISGPHNFQLKRFHFWKVQQTSDQHPSKNEMISTRLWNRNQKGKDFGEESEFLSEEYHDLSSTTVLQFLQNRRLFYSSTAEDN
jgi:hypothetical protein